MPVLAVLLNVPTPSPSSSSSSYPQAAEPRMPSKSSDLNQESPQIRKDDKFFSRLLSKEASSNPSFRVYYGGASGSVPFLWESQPGTPKNTIHTTQLPPLTPPPSYFSTPTRSKSYSKNKKSLKSNLFHAMLPKLSLRSKAPSPPPSLSLSSSSVSSSSTASSSSSTAGSHHRRRRSASSPRLSTSFSSSREEDEESDVNGGSPTSTLCFGMRQAPAGGFRGGSSYSVVLMKNALLSIVGHGSGQGTAAA